MVREIIMYGQEHMIDPKLRKIPALGDEKWTSLIEEKQELLNPLGAMPIFLSEVE